ncbi:MAG TPA: GIY-YIG nuclease family protein [Planctomycetota bacterium]|jgi:hypothetical protein
MASVTKRGFSIRIFLPDGTPDGLRTVEKSNWTGRCIVCPRAQFSDAKARSEFGKTGVYVLFGPSEEGDLPMIYIGEGDPVRPRLDQHYAKKDFWTTLILFTSKDENLNKAHVQYLESRLIQLAAEAKRCALDNGNAPQLPSLSEADCAEMEAFLDEMMLIYPLLGLGVFEKLAAPPPKTRILYLKVKGISARGYEAADGFVVLADSQAVIETVPSIHQYMLTLRSALRSKEILVERNGLFVLTQDYRFDSPSTAAGVLLGRTANGRIEWKDEHGKTLRDLQAEAVA